MGKGKYYFASLEDFTAFKKKCNGHFDSYTIESPSHFPCVGVMSGRPMGDYGYDEGIAP
jgi:hypothetical protein